MNVPAVFKEAMTVQQWLGHIRLKPCVNDLHPNFLYDQETGLTLYFSLIGPCFFLFGYSMRDKNIIAFSTPTNAKFIFPKSPDCYNKFTQLPLTHVGMPLLMLALHNPNEIVSPSMIHVPDNPIKDSTVLTNLIDQAEHAHEAIDNPSAYVPDLNYEAVDTTTEENSKLGTYLKWGVGLFLASKIFR